MEEVGKYMIKNGLQQNTSLPFEDLEVYQYVGLNEYPNNEGISRKYFYR